MLNHRLYYKKIKEDIQEYSYDLLRRCAPRNDGVFLIVNPR